MSLTDSTARDVARSASIASRRLATLSNAARNEALTALHQALDKNRTAILAANARDVEAATRDAESGSLSHSVLKRLDLSRPGKYDDMLEGILSVRDLDDPGETCSYVYDDHEADLPRGRSWQSDATDSFRRGAEFGKSQLSDWGSLDHLRSSPRSHCEYCRPGNQVWQRCYPERSVVALHTESRRS